MKKYAVLLLIFSASLIAEVIEFDLDLSPESVNFSSWMGRDVVEIPGGAVPFAQGEPGLPGVPRTFVLPQGSSIAEVTVEAIETEILPGRFDIAPVNVMTLSGSFQPAVPSAAYTSAEPFPARPVTQVSSGSRTGYRLGSFVLVPFIYEPLSGQLSMITSARVTVELVYDGTDDRTALTPRQIQTTEPLLANLVQNPEMLVSWAPETRPGTDGDPVWVAIGDESLESVMQPLVDHRNSVTGESEFVSVQWIQSNYSGYDTPEQIRNYLKDQFYNHALIYALIVGDYGETTRISSLTYGQNVLNNVIDHYYMDLNGDWDGDGDHQYGEENDGISYYSDLYVGRFSASNVNYIELMVEKTIAYETDPEAGPWQTTAVLAGAGLWPPDYWGSFICEDIDDIIPNDWTVEKLYENSSGHPNNQTDLISQGCSYMTPQGHGGAGGVYWYDYEPLEIVGNGNYTQMTNIDRLAVFHSMACMAGELTSDCIAERLVLSPLGGAVATMFNSSYGWGTPPYRGPSEWLELTFAQQLFTFEVMEIGVAQAFAKDAIQGLTGVPLIDWVTQENNLVGDPALTFVTGQTGIETTEGFAETGSLGSWPNPFSASCTISYDLPVTGNVDISVYDLSGRCVRNLSSGNLQAGSGSISFDGRDNGGSRLPTGSYSVVMTGAFGMESSMMVLTR